VTAAALVSTLHARGVTLKPRGDHLVARPVSRMTTDEVEALRRHKVEILELLRRETERPDPVEVARLLDLPISQLDRMVEVRVPWLPLTLWLVPSLRAAELLVQEGLSRGRIWTATELLNLLAVPGITTADARRLAEAKLEFDGEITGVRPVPEDLPC
jgi:hypothetical protein